MSFDFSFWALGGVAGLSLASTVAVAVKGLALQKRVDSLATQAPASAFDSTTVAGDIQAIADRVRSLNADIADLQGGLARNQNGVSGVNADLAEMRRDLDTLNTRLEDLKNSERSAPAPVDVDRRRPRFQTEMTSTPGNTNRRGQMMRMHRRGDSVPAIASALGISQGEVKLTIRMQELFSDLPDKDNSHDRL